jgi:hypothetical protein
MRFRLWDFMSRVHRFLPGDPATWRPGARPTGFQKLVRAGTFSEMASPALCEAADELLGPGASCGPKHWGPPLPVFPQRGPWTVPHEGWHMDVPATGESRCSGLRAFLLLDRIEPRGGATLVATGSQRVARRIAREAGRTAASSEIKDLLVRSEPWIRALLDREDRTDREQRFLVEAKAKDGTPLEVVELTGEPGDVILMDLCALHAASPNVRETPRLMVGQALYPVDARARASANARP